MVVIVSDLLYLSQDPVDLGWRPFVKTWLNRLPREMPESGKNHLQALFFHAIDKGVRFMRKHSRFLFLPVPEMSVIATLCNVLNAYISFLKDNGGFGSAGEVITACDLRETVCFVSARILFV